VLVLDVADKVASVVSALAAIAGLYIALRQANTNSDLRSIIFALQGRQDSPWPISETCPQPTDVPPTPPRRVRIHPHAVWILVLMLFVAGILRTYYELPEFKEYDLGFAPVAHETLLGSALFIIAGCIIFGHLDPKYYMHHPLLLDLVPIAAWGGYLYIFQASGLLLAVRESNGIGAPGSRLRRLAGLNLSLVTCLILVGSYIAYKPLVSPEAGLGVGNCFTIGRDPSNHFIRLTSQPCGYSSSYRLTRIVYSPDRNAMCPAGDGALIYVTNRVAICYQG
jgi:hypothetical protein